MKFLIIISTTILLTSCTSMRPEVDDGFAMVRTQIVECDERAKIGDFDSFYGASLCKTDAIKAELGKVFYPYMDLVDQYNATVLEASLQVDMGEMTEADAAQHFVAARKLWLNKEQERCAIDQYKWKETPLRKLNLVRWFNQGARPFKCYNLDM